MTYTSLRALSSYHPPRISWPTSWPPCMQHPVPSHSWVSSPYSISAYAGPSEPCGSWPSVRLTAGMVDRSCQMNWNSRCYSRRYCWMIGFSLEVEIRYYSVRSMSFQCTSKASILSTRLPTSHWLRGSSRPHIGPRPAPWPRAGAGAGAGAWASSPGRH